MKENENGKSQATTKRNVDSVGRKHFLSVVILVLYTLVQPIILSALIVNAIFELISIQAGLMMILVLLSAVAQVLFHWLAYSFCSFCSLSYDTLDTIGSAQIRMGEIWLRVIRVYIYIIVVFVTFFILEPLFPSFLNIPVLFKHKDYLTSTIFLSGIALFLSSYQSFGRLTFRTFPVIALAVALTLIFFCITGKPYAPNKLWGFYKKGIDLSVLSSQIERFQILLAGSALASGFLAIIVFLGKDVYDKYKLHLTSDTTKDTRRKLLSHWHFKGKAFIQDSTIIIAIAFAILCVVTVIFTMPPKSDTKSATSTAKTAQSNTNVAVTYPAETGNPAYSDCKTVVIVNVEKSGQESDDNNSNSENMLLSYLALMACGIAFFGIVTHFDITEKALSASEYRYLQYHSIYLLKKQPKKNGAPAKEKNQIKWDDYFQVLSYVFLHSSPIISENREWHKLNSTLKLLYQNADECGKAALVSGCVYIFSELQEKQQSSAKEDKSKLEQHQSVIVQPGKEDQTSVVSADNCQEKKNRDADRRPIGEPERLLSAEISALIGNIDAENNPDSQATQKALKVLTAAKLISKKLLPHVKRLKGNNNLSCCEYDFLISEPECSECIESNGAISIDKIKSKLTSFLDGITFLENTIVEQKWCLDLWEQMQEATRNAQNVYKYANEINVNYINRERLGVLQQQIKNELEQNFPNQVNNPPADSPPKAESAINSINEKIPLSLDELKKASKNLVNANSESLKAIEAGCLTALNNSWSAIVNPLNRLWSLVSHLIKIEEEIKSTVDGLDYTKIMDVSSANDLEKISISISIVLSNIEKCNCILEENMCQSNLKTIKEVLGQEEIIYLKKTVTELGPSDHPSAAGIDALNFLIQLDRLFFSETLRGELQRKLSAIGISTEEFIRVVRLDMLTIAAHWQSSNSCLLRWLCTETKSCQYNNGCDDVRCFEKNRRIFCIEYPFLACQCIEKRWPTDDAFENKTIREQIAVYFAKLAVCAVNPVTSNTKELDQVCDEFYAFVRANVSSIFTDAAIATMKLFDNSDEQHLFFCNQVFRHFGMNNMSIGPWKERDNLIDDSYGANRGMLSDCRNLVYLLFARNLASQQHQ